jgi:uncharacterized SAM-binding protein YcdF (DUF218 family)
VKLRPFFLLKTVIVGVLAIAVVALLIWAATRFVVVDHPLERADFIYVLNGRISVRAEHAARVYHDGLAPRVLVARTSETFPARPHRPRLSVGDSIARYVVGRGVPAAVVTTIPFGAGVVNTRDEGRALRQQLELEPARRVIVVTTDYHTGRARRTLQQELRGLDVELLMSAAPADDGITPRNWWASAAGISRYVREFVQQIGAIAQHATGTGQAAPPS